MTAVVPAEAGVDAELPLLAAGTDPEFVRQLFTTRISPDAPRGTSVLGCVRAHTDYQPAARCHLSYRLRLGAPGVEPWWSFGRVLVDPAGLDLCWYDEDPELPTLGVASSPTGMRERLERWSGEQAPAWTVSVVRYRAGVRCVLRYRAAGSGRELFGKLYAQDAERHAVAQVALRETLDSERAAGGSRPRVPAVVGHDRQLGLVVNTVVAGSSLRTLAFERAVPEATRLRALCATGGQLAGLHVSAGAAGPVRSFADDLAELRGYLAAARQADPRIAQRMARLIDLAADLPCGHTDLAPSHGALRTDQVLLGADGIVLLDLDGLGWAEPARDVGNLLGYLSWRALRLPAERRYLDAARAAFLDGYRERSRGLDEVLLNSYEAATLLKIAGRRFRSLQYDEWPAVPELVERAAALLPLRRHPPARAARARMAAVVDEATEPARMAGELAALPRADGPGPMPVRSADLLAYRADRTAVVRYTLADGRMALGKLYPDPGVALRAHDTHLRLSGALSGTDGPAVPEPIGVLPTLAMLVMEPVHGRPLDRVLGAAGAADTAVRAAAGWLARLHSSTVQLCRRLDLQTEQENVAAWARLVHTGLPECSVAAATLAAGVSVALGALRVGRYVPLHKDFHYQHVFVGARTAVIDLDEARMGDPALDVAHFCAYLELLAVRRATPATLRASFLRCYTEQRDWQPDEAYRVFSAWTCLKIAKQLATGRGPHPRPTGEQRLIQARHVLARGLLWLR